jgi:L-lactate dehydrogenase complex protein LldF
LCGACYEACPVKIDIPSVLIHLRGRIAREAHGDQAERISMVALARIFSSRRAYEAAQRTARLVSKPVAHDGRIERRLPGPLAGWLASRDLPVPAAPTFREWWRTRPEQPRPSGLGRA